MSPPMSPRLLVNHALLDWAIRHGIDPDTTLRHLDVTAAPTREHPHQVRIRYTVADGRSPEVRELLTDEPPPPDHAPPPPRPLRRPPMSKPLITASHERDSVEDRSMCGVVHTTPGVSLVVTFQLGDHQDALTALEHATADVRRQIADAAEGTRR